MKQKQARILIFCVLIAYSIFLFLGVRDVPFHPDESSVLYQSRDFERLLSDPGSLAWDSENLDDYDQQYRALNAPLAKYVLAIGRRFSGFGPEAVSTDWDWSKTWRENEASGALPSGHLLTASRLSVTALLPFSVLLIALSGRALRDKSTATIAAIVLATNALILLHNRRAMAEGVMTFGVCMAVLGMFQARRRPWLAGLGAALAAAAKYSTAPLLLVNLLACAWRPSTEPASWKQTARNIITYLAVAGVVLFVLSPIAWSAPIEAVFNIWSVRQELLRQQVETLRALLPVQVLDTIPKRAAVMLGHLYLAPLQFEEVGNYVEQTSATQNTYLACPLHNLLRGNLGAGVMLMLTIFGLGLGARRLFSTKDAQTRRNLVLLFLATIFQIVALLIANPLPYQRYWIPVVPFICLWIAYGVAEMVQNRKKQDA